ncbi:GntR family transcriptional regulator [Clostridium magnum]|uniref:HTH-type transcriptional repressor YtrA n=1 Tax=Clostridium magnum DSM 2767 TaxID=1121326 RepID=A0A161WW71_9CLOT|nr:GntR family transcriptional regulator [Clostridium magnum]KZL91218.1 HTH-type transcriptional repressor YtrA [Clostridium magnum DSM 2767]SHI33170.1 transcriptional regulator, GntR family [Clostridium magnum DSM 2767]
MGISFDPKIPIYIQIMHLVKRDIVIKKLKPGDKLPSVRDMASELQVNPNTLQRAYQELEREGITYTQRGMGTFVREDTDMIGELKKEMAKEIIDNFMKGMKNLGFTGKEILTVIEDKVKEEF